jgi:1-aminocyclopropane-1-carboxylate deaminase
MQLEFIPRTAYQAQKLTSGLDPQSKTWFIPEGGANPEGIWGCQQIYQEALIQNNNRHFDAVFIAQGTTTTSLGILASLPQTTQLFVVPVLKGFDSRAEMQKLISESKNNPLTSTLHFPLQQVHFLDEYHHGGYAKTSKELIDFINFFNQTNQFPIEPTYTGKALYALSHELPKLQPSIKNVLFIHTGGVHTPTP